MYTEDVKQLFKSNNIKNTQQRHMVYSILKSKKQPITTEEIYKIISGKLEKPINLSTVYRILEVFTEKELILKSQIHINGKALYEINHREHRHHLICIKCNKIIPIKGCPLGEYEQILEKQTGYKIIEHNLEIKGICPKCQKR
ncbi:MAG: Fur family transcriptional regulator [Gudongella sp.]|nr:Fur family transcriptional regulator [Gudongella sp.]